MNVHKKLHKRLTVLVQSNERVRRKSRYDKCPIHTHVAKLKLGVLEDKRTHARANNRDDRENVRFNYAPNLWALLVLGTFDKLAQSSECIERTPQIHFTRSYYDRSSCRWLEHCVDRSRWIKAHTFDEPTVVACQRLDWWFDVAVEIGVQVEQPAMPATLKAIDQANGADNPFAKETRAGTPLFICQHSVRSLRFARTAQWRVDVTVIDRTARLDENGSPGNDLQQLYVLELCYDPQIEGICTEQSVKQALLLLEMIARALASTTTEAHELVYYKSAEWSAQHDYM